MSQHAADHIDPKIHTHPALAPPRRSRMKQAAYIIIRMLAVEFVIIGLGALMLWLIGPYLPQALVFDRNYATAFVVFAGIRAMIKLWSTAR